LRPNHHQFIAFAYVVREGNFSAAAARLGVTQSTITQHVAKLEKQIGTQLLLRGRDGVNVTRTGQEFFDLADRLVTLDSAISERLEGFEAMQKGHLKVIANAPQPALRAILAFQDSFPGVQVDFALHDWTTATKMIRNRRADVGLITDAPRSEEWDIIPLQKLSYVAYVPTPGPFAQVRSLSLKDLEHETVILPEQGSLTERVIHAAIKKHGVVLNRTIRMTTFPLMCEAVLQGIGVALFLGRSGLIAKGLREIPVRELQHGHQISIVAPKDRARLRLIKSFVETASDLEFE